MTIATTLPGGLPTELLSWSSLGTFAGLTGATTAITNAISRAAGWSPAWFGLAVALLLCVGVTLMQPAFTAPQLVLAAINACAIYLSASGASSVGTALAGSGPLPPPGAGKTGFWRRWH
jgi:hypothetical protein